MAQLAIALPILERAQRDEGPWWELEELLATMRTAAYRRGLLTQANERAPKDPPVTPDPEPGA